MRKYNIFVTFESTTEFEKLHVQFTDIYNAIEYVSEFIENVNNLRKAIGVNKRLTDENWYILSNDKKVLINYDYLNNMYEIIDYDKLEKILVSKNSKTALMSL